MTTWVPGVSFEIITVRLSTSTMVWFVVGTLRPSLRTIVFESTRDTVPVYKRGALGADVTTVVVGAGGAGVAATTRSRVRPLKGILLTDGIGTYPAGRTVSTAACRAAWDTSISRGRA